MRAYVELPDGGESWATRRTWLTALERLGYRVDLLGAGRSWVLLLS